MLLGIFGWIVLGLIIGFVANNAVNLRNEDPGLGLGVGALAAVIGGWLYSMITGSPIAAFNPWSLLFAGIAAVVGLLIWHMWRTRAVRT